MKGFSIVDRLKSFVFAIKGIKYTLLTQHNFRIHIVLAIIAIILGFLLKISWLEWISIIIVIGMVLAAEIFNSSIEELMNLISPDKNKIAGIVKDLSAGAVLILAITSFIIGIIIFLPKILELL
ncbi:MAG: diacylglycerol kinase [Bacteroidetes bacterium]|nr:diacylglycerol kinase [Bacteroidota bacterium]